MANVILKVNSADTSGAWTRVGTTPYLSAQDQPTNYEHSASRNANSDVFGFEDSADLGTITSVTLYIYAQQGGASNDFTTIVNSTDTGLGPPATWGLVSVSVTSITGTTWAGVNAATMYFDKPNTANDPAVDYAYLDVQYTPATVTYTKDNSAKANIKRTVSDNTNNSKANIKVTVSNNTNNAKASIYYKDVSKNQNVKANIKITVSDKTNNSKANIKRVDVTQNNSVRANLALPTVEYTQNNSSKANIVRTVVQPPQQDWYNPSWLYRVKVTVQASKVDADLTDYPVYVDLSDLPADFHAHVNQTDARDIRVTTSTGVDEVPREVVFYDSATDTGELHFKGNILNNDNVDFYIYYGNGGASGYTRDAEFGSDNVWKGSYQFVGHFQNNTNDSTGYQNNFTDTNTTSQAGNIGNGRLLDAVDETISHASLLNGVSAFTITAYVRFDALTADNVIVQKGPTFGATAPIIFWRDEAGSSRSQTDTIATLVSNGTSTARIEANTNSANATGFYHLGATFTGGSATGLRQYINGVESTEDSPKDTSLVSTLASGTIYLGTSVDNRFIDGLVDEIRIATADFGGSWVSTEENNLSSPSTFYQTETEEEYGGGAYWSKASILRTETDNNSSLANVLKIDETQENSVRAFILGEAVIYSKDSSAKADILTIGVLNDSSAKGQIVLYQTDNNSSKANISITTENNNSVKGNILSTIQQANSVRGNIVRFNETQNNSAKASIVTTPTKDNSALADIKVTLEKNNNAKGSIVTSGQSANSSKADILRSDETSDVQVKANISVQSTDDNSAKSNIVVTEINNNEAIANLYSSTSQDNSAKGYIYIEEFTLCTDLWSVTYKTPTRSKANSAKANIVITEEYDNQVHSNILAISSQDNKTKANIFVENNVIDNTSKANILRVGVSQNNSTKADVLRTETSNHSVKAQIYIIPTHDNDVKGNILKVQEKVNSALGQIVTSGAVFNYVKANILVVNNKQESSAKANIVITYEKANSSKASIYQSHTNNQNSKANIRVTQAQDNFVLASVAGVSYYQSSVKANIIASVACDTSSKASIVVTEIEESLVKANILRTETQENDSKASIYRTETQDVDVKANISGLKENYVTADILRENETQDNSAKANIVTTAISYDNFACAYITRNIIYTPKTTPYRASCPRVYQPRRNIYSPMVDVYNRLKARR